MMVGAAGSLFVALLLILAVTACTNGGNGDADSQLLDEENATVTMYVSNQSFDDDPVGITVLIDGETVVDQEFRVGNQHTWIEFGLALTPGTHQLTATSSTGIEHSAAIEVPADGHLWTVVDYWFYKDDLDRSFSVRSQTEPIGFD